jgi:phosphoglycerate dehydrogenase-like enzyme
MNIIIPDPIDIPAPSIQKLRDIGAQIYDSAPKDDQELIRRIKDADIITANWITVSPSVIDGAPQLKYIITPTVGHDHVDVGYANSKGIVVLNCPTFVTQAVAEHALALLFAIHRKIIAASNSLKDGAWECTSFMGGELYQKQLGLIGYGNIGKRVEKLLAGFEMTTIAVNSKSTTQELDTLMKSADIIVICAPLTDRTNGLLDERRLALCKPGAIIINVGRGAIIDQDALVRVLAVRQLYVGLDVFVDEPLDGKPNSQIVQLANLPNVVATPHIACSTKEALARLGQEIYDDIQSCLAGQPINAVT